MLRRTTGSDMMTIYFNQKPWKEMGCGDGEKKSISIHLSVNIKQRYVKLPLCPHDPRTIPLITAQVITGQMSWTPWNYRVGKRPAHPWAQSLWGFSASASSGDHPVGLGSFQQTALSPGMAVLKWGGIWEGRLEAETLTGQIPRLQGSSRTCLCLVLSQLAMAGRTMAGDNWGTKGRMVGAPGPHRHLHHHLQLHSHSSWLPELLLWTVLFL